MLGSKYFQTGSKVTVRTGGIGEQRREIFSARLAAVSAERFTLTLPYPGRNAAGNQLLFSSGTEACILSEAFGLGIQVSGEIDEQIDGTTFLVRHRGALEMVPRRKHYRIDTTIGIEVTRSCAPFGDLRRHWTAAVERLAAGETPPQFATLERRAVSLSAGGIGISLKAPVTEAELSLLLLDIGDGKGPIWTLGEVVWVRPGEDSMQRCGLRFVEFDLHDMNRINDFVIQELKKQGEDVVWYSSLRKKLDRMEF